MPGQEVTDLDEIPFDMVGRKIPPSTYAVFTHLGLLAKLPETFHYGHKTWLPASPYEPAGWFDLELYDSRFKGDSEDSEVDVCIPIRKK